MREETSKKNPRWVGYALALVLLLNLALRVANGSTGLDSTRFFDERFSLRNVAAVLLEGTSQPSNAFYGSLSYLPQAAALYVSETLHKLTGVEWLAIRSERSSDGWSKTAYFITRAVCAVFGTLSLWLTFLLGRRLFGPEVGLLAAIFYGAFPRHLLASTEFKPDILVVVLVLLTYLWSLDAAADPTRRKVLLAGCGVGLAVATKYTGVGVAIPLTIGVLWHGFRDRKLWFTLVGAGLVSMVTFFVLNPHVAVIFAYLPRIWRIMEDKGEASGDSHLDVLFREGEFLWNHHGPVLLFFALAGFAAMARRLWRGTGGERREAAMFLGYIVGYSLLYAAATKLFKGQNYLPVAAFTSVLSAWAMWFSWQRLTASVAPRVRTGLAVLLTLLGSGWIYSASATYTYLDGVPTTMEQAQDFLRRSLNPFELRHIYYERTNFDDDHYAKRRHALRLATAGGHWMVALPSEELFEREEQTLDLSDAEVFPVSRLDDERYLRRVVAHDSAQRFESSVLGAWGDDLVVLSHPWHLRAEPELFTLENLGQNAYRTVLETPMTAGEAVSFSIWLPRRTGSEKPRWVRIDGEEHQIFRTRLGGKRIHYVSLRWRWPEDTNQLEFSFDSRLRLEQGVEIRLARWDPP